MFVVYWESPIGKGLFSSDHILVEGMLFERLNVECWSGRLCRACFMVKFWFEKEVRSMQKFFGCEQQLEKLDTLWRRDYSSFVWVESGDGKTFARNPLSVARQLNTVYLRKVHAGSTVTSKPTMRHLRGYLACYRDVCETLSREAWDAKTRKALLDRCVVYKLNVRRIADSCPDLVVEAKGVMLKDEYDELCKVLVYPLGEKIVNGFRCLCEHGLRYTLRRILFGRLR